MSQEGYITDILKRYDIPESKKARSPCSPKFLKRQTSGPGSAPADSTLFRSQLMAAAYLGIRTRPDIRFAVGHLASRSSNPSQHDMGCLQHQPPAYCFHRCQLRYTRRWQRAYRHHNHDG
mmetsp:Transcript_6761/g.9439  ORF Transcript_6761/g.9439 Transcript_6761/m.9439 type:complete len:120 (+) Transcript_6761:842-1201(+)